jgi:hypothetical protein
MQAEELGFALNFTHRQKIEFVGRIRLGHADQNITLQVYSHVLPRTGIESIPSSRMSSQLTVHKNEKSPGNWL